MNLTKMGAKTTQEHFSVAGLCTARELSTSSQGLCRLVLGRSLEREVKREGSQLAPHLINDVRVSGVKHYVPFKHGGSKWEARFSVWR